MADRVKVTLIKSTIGAVPKNKKTIEALGLTKLGKTVELPNNADYTGSCSQSSTIRKSRRSLRIK